MTREKINISKKKDSINLLIGISIGILISILSIMWVYSITINVKNFENVKNIDIIKDYAQFATTFFGFSLVGGIFEGKTKDKPYMLRHLFIISLIFLLSTLSFILSYSTFNMVDGVSWFVIPASWFAITCKVSFCIGAYSFIIAIFLLSFELIQYYLIAFRHLNSN